MNSESDQFHKIITLAEASLDDCLEPEQVQELDQLIQEDLIARQSYVAYLDLHAELINLADESTPEDHFWDFIEAASRRPWYARPSFWVTTSSVVMALTMLIAIGLGIYFYEPPPPPQVALIRAYTEDASRNSEHAIQIGEVLRADQKISLTEGMITVELDDGALVDVMAPADLQFVSANKIDLTQGQLKAWVPQRAVGFTVSTPEATIIDRGTEFLVNHQLGMGTKVSVRQGMVDVSVLDANGQSIREVPLAAAQSALIRLDEIKNSGYQSEKFHPYDLVRGGIESLNGSSQLVSTQLLVLESGVHSTLNHVLVIPEVQQFVVNQKLDIQTLNGKISLQKGEIISSYLVHCDPGQYIVNAPIGNIKFGAPIAGVITSAAELKRTDPLFGHPEARFEQNTYRGLELNDHDRITFADQNRILSYHLNMSPPNFMDEFRIIVKEGIQQNTN